MVCSLPVSAEMTVVLGAHNISKEEKSQQRIKVAKFIPHEKFTGGYDNDIMLLKVNKSMQKFTSKKHGCSQSLCKMGGSNVG